MVARDEDIFRPIRGGACSAKGNLSPKDTKPAEGVENAKFLLFSPSAVVVLVRVVKLT